MKTPKYLYAVMEMCGDIKQIAKFGGCYAIYPTLKEANEGKRWFTNIAEKCWDAKYTIEKYTSNKGKTYEN